MGYLSNGQFVQITDQDGPLLREIKEETTKVYKQRYGSRDPASLSTKEREAISHEASVRVQDRRRGRLVP